ncbi:MAG: hypothetical protein ACJ8DI_25810 [Ktedonobacteraceae bacterium]
MRISDVIGLLAALLGSTATVFVAWGYIRAQRPSKRELFRVILTVTVIMVCILSFAVLISRASTIKINNQENIPLGPLVPSGTTPAPGLTPSPSLSPSPTVTPSPSSTPTSSPSSTPTPSPTLTPLPSPAATPTKTGGQ